MPETGQPARRATVLTAAGALAVVCGAVITALGGTPAIQLFGVAALLVICLGQAMGWLLATGASLVLTMVAAMLLALLFPAVGVPIAMGENVALTLAGAFCVGIALSRGPRLRVPDRRGVAVAVGAVVPSIVMVAWYTLVDALASVPKLTWMMQNDSAWNLALTRVFLEDGGFDPATHPNVAPGTYIVMSSFAAPGRPAVGSDELLFHDVTRVAWALLLVMSVVSVLFGLVAATFLPARHAVARTVVTAAVAVVPWSWVLFGLAARYGFWNSFLAAALMPVAWLAWKAAESTPRLASAVMAATGLALLAVWAPLVILPGIMGLALVVRHRRTHLALRGWALAGWLAPPVALVGWYAGTMATAARDNAGGLADDGAFFGLRTSDVAVSIAITLATAVVVACVRGKGWDALGIALVAFAGAAGVGALVVQRIAGGSTWWGYYPAKFAWLIMLLTIPLLVGSAASLVRLVPGSAVRRAGLVAGCLGLAPAVLVNISPVDLRLPTTAALALNKAPDWRPVSIVPMLSITIDNGMSGYDEAAPTLFEQAASGRKVVVLELEKDRIYDRWLTFWLIQLRAEGGDDPVRGYAYTGLIYVQDLCDLAEDWGDGVTVVTRWKGMAKAVDGTCPSEGIVVELQSG